MAAVEEEETPLTFIDVLTMNKNELIAQLEKLDVDVKGLNKVSLQVALMQQLKFTDSVGIDTMAAVLTKTSPSELSHASSVESIHSKVDSEEGNGVKNDLSDNELQLKLTRLQFDREERERERDREREREREKHELQKLALEQAHELALRQLEANTAAAGASQTSPTPTAPPFRVDVAIKLIPKFNENDLESFLLSFEKIAALNNFPRGKYAAILQAHLTGRALKVFTELSTADCQDYDKLKAALLTAYAVVPEVYRKRFRTTTKNNSETFSDFAFRLSTIFKRWMEGVKAFADLPTMKEVIMLEQFQECLEQDVRIWLIDQKPKTLCEAARLADQYVAIHRQGKRFNQINNGRGLSQNKDQTQTVEAKPEVTEVKTVDKARVFYPKPGAASTTLPQKSRYNVLTVVVLVI